MDGQARTDPMLKWRYPRKGVSPYIQRLPAAQPSDFKFVEASEYGSIQDPPLPAVETLPVVDNSNA